LTIHFQILEDRETVRVIVLMDGKALGPPLSLDEHFKLVQRVSRAYRKALDFQRDLDRNA
jgi:hypothetical protein